MNQKSRRDRGDTLAEQKESKWDCLESAKRMLGHRVKSDKRREVDGRNNWRHRN